MATTIEAKVNRIGLNRMADLTFETENLYYPYGSFAAKDLPEVLESIGADTIIVDYQTISDPKARERDRVKYTKRLEALAHLYDRSEWTQRVIRGFVHADTMVCTLTRKAV